MRDSAPVSWLVHIYGSAPVGCGHVRFLYWLAESLIIQINGVIIIVVIDFMNERFFNNNQIKYMFLIYASVYVFITSSAPEIVSAFIKSSIVRRPRGSTMSICFMHSQMVLMIP